MARCGGCDTAIIGLEGRCREIPLSVSARRLWIFFAVRINPSLSNRPRLGSLWSLMPPTPAVGEPPGAPTRRVGRMPARCAARDRRAGRWRAGSTLVVGDEPLDPLVGEVSRDEPRDLLRVDRQRGHDPRRTWAWGWSAGWR